MILKNFRGGEEWDSFVTQHTDGLLFHHSDWLNLLALQYGFKFTLAHTGEINNLNEAIIFAEVSSIRGGKSLISLPFVDFCTPLVNQGSSLFNETIEYALENKIGEIEIRDIVSDSKFQPLTESVVHEIDLTQELSVIEKAYIDMHRRGIKKAVNGGLAVKVSREEDALEQFYQLHLLTRKKLGVPIQPKGFFRQLLTVIKKHGEVMTVSSGDNVIAAAVFLRSGKKYIYKYGASDPAAMGLRPNNLLFSEAIKIAHSEGFKFFNFGKTDIPNEGLRNFKKGWGATETELPVNFYPAIPQPGILKKIKEELVAPVIKNSPPVVCRIIGELAYKFFPSL